MFSANRGRPLGLAHAPSVVWINIFDGSPSSKKTVACQRGKLFAAIARFRVFPAQIMSQWQAVLSTECKAVASQKLRKVEVDHSMGRDANCLCHWGAESGACKVQLETHELILRGAIRRSVPITSLTNVHVDQDQLIFQVHGEEVALTLGAANAKSWARKIATPPPTLAAKLGILPSSRIMLIGAPAPLEINHAAEQATLDPEHPTLVIATIKTAADLHHALSYYSEMRDNPPLWIVYVKGSGQPIGESVIRETLRATGFMDVKVASVSPTQTALKFLRRV
jgi:hypothetical protein